MKKLRSITMALLFLFTAQYTFAQNQVNKDDSNLAVQGYDVIEYFTSHEAVRGNAEFSTTHDGAIYYFTSEENLAMFKESPEAYTPEYGGYCAYGIAQGVKFPIDPATFKIRDGKLYLFFNDFNEGKPFNTIVPWNTGDEQELIKQANSNWVKK